MAGPCEMERFLLLKGNVMTAEVTDDGCDGGGSVFKGSAKHQSRCSCRYRRTGSPVTGQLETSDGGGWGGATSVKSPTLDHVAFAALKA